MLRISYLARRYAQICTFPCLSIARAKSNIAAIFADLSTHIRIHIEIKDYSSIKRNERDRLKEIVSHFINYILFASMYKISCTRYHRIVVTIVTFNVQN